MQIQPYFPEQIEIRGNVAAERYQVTLSFIRAVTLGHVASLLCIVAVAARVEPVFSLSTYAIVFFSCLIAMTVSRRLLQGGNADNAISLVLMAPTIWTLGVIVRYTYDLGQPVWIIGLSCLSAALYCASCGRDFSFIGQIVCTMIATATIVLLAGLLGFVGWAEAAVWSACALAYACYYVYDSAALLSRRRLGEEVSAVADLYRDLLNFSTYTVRIALHWRRFKFI